MTISVLDRVAGWPVPHTAAAMVIAPEGGAPYVAARHGETDRRFRIASLSKPLTAWAVLIAVEEGLLALDSPIGQPGCTLEHLLAHAGGYPFDGAEPVAAPGRRRIYSNTGIELAAAAVAAAAEMPFAEYLHEAVFAPLGMTASDLRGSPAYAVWSTVDDLVRFIGELAQTRLVSATTAAQATQPVFADLAGIVPGVGRFDPCPWGLGVEIHGAKAPHWMGTANSPATFGHFGGAGTMMWVDPAAHTSATVGLVALTDRDFDAWRDVALAEWPALSDEVIAAAHAVVDGGER